MSTIYFRRRKEHDTVDSSYFLYDGPNATEAKHWLIGDEVTVMFSADDEMTKACASLGQHKFTIYGNIAQIPCTVVKRSHAAMWKMTGNLQDLGTQIVLEANSGLWEDLLLWIIFGKRPQWAELDV